MDEDTRSIDGHRIIVAGGASGIGRATASLLVRRGARVACVDRNADALAETVAQLGQDGGDVQGVTVDVGDVEQVRHGLGGLITSWGGVEAMLNCAGIVGRTGIKSHLLDVEEFDDVVAVNLRAAFLLSQAVIPAMLEHRYGRIVHVASMAGKDGNAGMVAYSASKAGLIGMVKTMGKDYADAGITINSIAPVPIQTPMVDELPQAQLDYLLERIPMGRFGGLEEVAEQLAWMLSPACSFTTGFTFDFSGGRSTY